MNTKVITDKKEIANAFCSYFTDIGSSIHNYIGNLSNKVWKCFSSDLTNTINPGGFTFKFNHVYTGQVYTLLESLNSTKAAGFDCIPTKLIKDGASGLASTLCILITRSLDESVFPAMEKLAKISPIYKTGGDHSLLDNYRPISVLNVPLKSDREVCLLPIIRLS